jgi:hypothetical protein
MRRYAVRFLVAVLTFGIGVALSLVFGLFRVRETTTSYILESRRGCPKQFKLSASPVFTIDSERSDPLRLTYLGATSDSRYPLAHQQEFRVENTTGNTIVGYSVSGERIGQKGATFFDWTSNRVLLPGESEKVVLPANAEGLLVRVNQVTYQSGFSWINPRGVRF